MTDEMKTRPWSEVKAEARAKMTPEELVLHDAEVERLKAAHEFCESVQGDWEDTMEKFFEQSVDAAQQRKGLSREQVRDALQEGYGHAVAEAWEEWCE